MQHHHQGDPPGTLQLAQDVQDLHLAGDVQVGGGLVQQQHLGLLGQGQGDPHALSLASGEIGHVAVHEIAQTGELERLGHGGVVLRAPAPEGPAVRVATARDQLPHAHPLRRHGVLRQEAHRLRKTGAVPAADVLPAHEHLSGGGGQLARARAEQRGLAAAVGAHERRDAPRWERDVHVREHGCATVAGTQSAHGHLGRRRPDGPRGARRFCGPGLVPRARRGVPELVLGAHASAFPRPMSSHSSAGAPAAAVTTPTGSARLGSASAAT